MKGFFKINPVQLGVVYLLVGLLASSIIYWQGISPAQTKIEQLLEEGQKQAQLLVNIKAFSQEKNYAAYTAGLEEQCDLLKAALPTQASLEEQLAGYYALAEEEGVKLLRLQAPPNQNKEVKIQLKAIGPYPAIINFMQRLEGKGHFLTLEQLRLQGEKGNTVILSAQLVSPK